jgi:cytidylate kinase
MSERPLIIAIDGPSGAGKGTVARRLAGHLGYRHVDTGAMYRAVAWLATQKGVDLADANAVAAVAQQAAIDLEGGVRIDGHDITQAIRTADMDAAAGQVARHAPVRAVLVQRQRGYRTDRGLVMEGRDIGTVVFPDADIKLYLDASPDERARRRAADSAHAIGREGAGVDGVAQALEARDRSDRTRAISPLTIAADAIYLDTTGMGIDAVLERVLTLVEQASKNP